MVKRLIQITQEWNYTDPNNMDTDGDGVTDGDEVSNGTDPTVAYTPTNEYHLIEHELTEMGSVFSIRSILWW